MQTSCLSLGGNQLTNWISKGWISKGFMIDALRPNKLIELCCASGLQHRQHVLEEARFQNDEHSINWDAIDSYSLQCSAFARHAAHAKSSYCMRTPMVAVPLWRISPCLAEVPRCSWFAHSITLSTLIWWLLTEQSSQRGRMSTNTAPLRASRPLTPEAQCC